jgi:hypothetical protein
MNINHEVRVKVEEQNQDLLNLEQEYVKKKAAAEVSDEATEAPKQKPSKKSKKTAS